MTPPLISADLLARIQVIDGLRELADCLDHHPDAPVPEFGWDLNIYPLDPTDAARRADVDSVAAVLGVSPADRTDDGGPYSVAKSFARTTYPVDSVPNP